MAIYPDIDHAFQIDGQWYRRAHHVESIQRDGTGYTVHHAPTHHPDEASLVEHGHLIPTEGPTPAQQIAAILPSSTLAWLDERLADDPDWQAARPRPSSKRTRKRTGKG